MADLFGLDLREIVADALESAGGLRLGTLTRETASARDLDDLTAAPTVTITNFGFSGFVAVQSVRRDETLIVETIAVMTIIGGSISPATVPAVNDKATIDSITYELVRLITSDPAEAVYQFEVS